MVKILSEQIVHIIWVSETFQSRKLLEN